MAVFTQSSPLESALAPSKSPFAYQLDHADVTSAWRLKATSTPLLVWKSHDMALQESIIMLLIFLAPKSCQCPTVLILLEKNRYHSNTKDTNNTNNKKECHARITLLPVISWWILWWEDHHLPIEARATPAATQECTSTRLHLSMDAQWWDILE